MSTKPRSVAATGVRCLAPEACAGLGYRQMVAVVGGSDQWPSIGLHRALGFSWAGMLPAVGAKFGGWVDVLLMQRALGGGATTMPTGTGGNHD
jgi:phosphinothricin acetyltransferase